MGDSVVHALDNVDLDIERGEFVAITGASGSGKSTIMHLFGCLDRPSAGTIVFNGRDVSDISDRELASIRNKQIGFVFQTFSLINRTTALDNVGTPLFYARRSNSRGPARAALERVSLANRAHHRSNELSGGERQRVAIARAIVNDPLLVLADEPTGNLDSRTGEQIMAIFRSLNEQGVTIVLVTHEQEVAVQAGRIVQMRDGKIVADGPGEQARGGTVPATNIKETPSAAPVARPRGIAPAPATTATPAFSPRMARGATRALALGIVAPCLAVVSAVAGGLIRQQKQGLSLNEMPPTPFLIMAGFATLTLLLAIVFGIIAIFTGRAALKRVHNEPGAWRGTGRARAGRLLGWLGILLPFLIPALRALI
ncbi:MAG: ABC transporter ATP-binding protein [Planctomycetes bacterium]|nr:ABC transporter ATP-binding protein [Planctomycetota bacterium]